MTQEDLKESRGLYYDIDNCITELLKARTEKDQTAEGKALFRMEGLMVGTLQHLAYLIEREENKLPEGLEEAAERYNEMMSWAWEAPSYPHKAAFIAGAEWMKSKTMKEAVEGVARPDDCEIWVNLIGYGYKVKDGDKVRVIVIKEDEK